MLWLVDIHGGRGGIDGRWKEGGRGRGNACQYVKLIKNFFQEGLHISASYVSLNSFFNDEVKMECKEMLFWKN